MELLKTTLDKAFFSPCVYQAIPTDDYKVYVYFNDGSVRCVDVKPYIRANTVFEPLNDINVFKSKLTVIQGRVAWDLEGNRDVYKCVDLDTFEIFNLPPISDPIVAENIKAKK